MSAIVDRESAGSSDVAPQVAALPVGGTVGLRQVQHLLGDERLDHLFGHRRDARDRHFAQ
jgi:hypothetical protein